MTFPHYLATEFANHRIESRLAEAEHHRLLRRLRKFRKAAKNAKANRVPQQRTRLDDRIADTREAESRRAA